MSTTTSATAGVPRPSASLAIINARNEVLLVHRNPKARSFAGVHVFPGGNVDPAQDDCLGITAIRETFEESGLLITTARADVEHSVLDAGRKAIHSGQLSFQAFLSEHQLKPDTASLLPFTQWITPVTVPRRFSTQFFVVFLAASKSAEKNTWEDRIPTPDGGLEVISARFVRPRVALREYREGKISLMPPQYYIMSTLADILDPSDIPNTNTREQREKVVRLSRGAFGSMVINPQFNKGPADKQTITYEGDETRGGSPGRLHRAVVKMGKAGPAPMEYDLFRNFDIFTEIEAAPEPSQTIAASKL